MKKTLFFGLCLLSFQPFAAENIWCSGKLEGVYINSSGEVTIKGNWNSNWTSICNTKNPNAGIDLATCSLWASYAATAVKDKLEVMLMYSSTTYQCNTLPSYGSTPVPYYFMLKATN
jgi:hypothetical protein